MYRRKKARDFFVQRARQAYEKVFDEENDGYFYYNKITDTSQWNAPKVLLGRPLDPKVRSVRGPLSVLEGCKAKLVAAVNNEGKGDLHRQTLVLN